MDVDEHGFASVQQLTRALQKRGWANLEPEELITRLQSPDVERFQLVGDRVRARYGHSIEITYDFPRAEVRDPLYHGTSRSAWNSIRKQGLKPLGRSHVHLSRNSQEAGRVGRRHDAKPVIIEVNVPEDHQPNWLDAGPVILADHVPPSWLTRWN